MRKWMSLSVGTMILGFVVLAAQGPTAARRTTGGRAKDGCQPHRQGRRLSQQRAGDARGGRARRATASLKLVVSPLPMHVVNSSLYSEGGNGIRILSTRFRTRQVLEDTREDVRKLEDELKKLQMATQKIVSESKAIEQNMAMLAKLEDFTSVTTVSSTEKGGLNGDTVITLAKYVMEQRAEKASELVDLQQKLDTLKEQTDFAQRKLQELTVRHQQDGPRRGHRRGPGQRRRRQGAAQLPRGCGVVAAALQAPRRQGG